MHPPVGLKQPKLTRVHVSLKGERTQERAFRESLGRAHGTTDTVNGEYKAAHCRECAQAGRRRADGLMGHLERHAEAHVERHPQAHMRNCARITWRGT